MPNVGQLLDGNYTLELRTQKFESDYFGANHADISQQGSNVDGSPTT